MPLPLPKQPPLVSEVGPVLDYLLCSLHQMHDALSRNGGLEAVVFGKGAVQSRKRLQLLNCSHCSLSFYIRLVLGTIFMVSMKKK